MSTIFLLIIILLILVVLSMFTCVMKKTWYKIMFGSIKKMFIGLLNVCAVGSFGE